MEPIFLCSIYKELQHLAASQSSASRGGIATGDNRFFTFNREKITVLAFLAYLLPRSLFASRFPFLQALISMIWKIRQICLSAGC